MLRAALESGSGCLLGGTGSLRDERGRRRIVRNGNLRSREIVAGAGVLWDSQPLVRDKATIGGERIVFSSKILSRYLRTSQSME